MQNKPTLNVTMTLNVSGKSIDWFLYESNTGI